MITDDEAIERVARALCIAEYMDPDTPIFSGEPIRVRGGYVLTSQKPHALWTDYAPAAKVAIDAVEQLPPDYLEMLTA